MEEVIDVAAANTFPDLPLLRAMMVPKPVEDVGTVRPLANRYSYFFHRLRNFENWTILRGAYTLIARPDLGTLRRAAEVLVSHHDGLRLRAKDDVSTWTETIVDSSKTSPIVSLRCIQTQNERSVLIQSVNEIMKSLSLSGDLFRVVHLKTRTRDLLFFVTHHLVADGFSVNVVASDFFRIYGALLLKHPGELPTKTTSYRAFCEASFQFWTHKAEEEVQYWNSLAWDTAHRLQGDRPSTSEANTEAYSFSVVKPLPFGRGELGTLYRRIGWQAAELIIAATARAYADWTEGGVLHLALVVHGRESFLAQADMSRTVGWISETVPLLIDGRLSRQDLLRECRRQLRQVARRGKSYGVLCHLSPKVYGLRQALLPNVSLNLKLSRLPMFEAAELFIREQALALTDQVPASTQRVFILSGGVYPDKEGRLVLSWDFSEKMLHRSDIAYFTDLCVENIVILLQSNLEMER